MRSFGAVKTSIWNDADFVALGVRPQRLYILLLSQPHVSACGVLPLQPRRWAQLASDESTTGVTRALKALEGADFVVVDETTEEVWIRSFIRHDALGRQNREMAAKEAVEIVHSRTIFERCRGEYPQLFPAVAGESKVFHRNGHGPDPIKDQSPSPGDVDLAGDLAVEKSLSSQTILDEQVIRFVLRVGFQYDDETLVDELAKRGVSQAVSAPYLELARSARSLRPNGTGAIAA